jgi:hypothetical protein
MRPRRLLLAVLISPLLAAVAGADGEPSVDRKIGKEPAYGADPVYALLVLGKEGKTRVWLVRDYDTLYIDRNGNGDLTDDEPLKVSEQGAGVLTFRLARLPDSQSQRGHSDLEVRVVLGSRKEKRPESWAVRLDIGGGYRELVVGAEPADRPCGSPVVSLGKPLRISAFAGLTFTPGKETELPAVISSMTAGSAVLHETIPPGVHPVAEIAFPGKTPGAKPVVLRVQLTQRC